MAVLRDILQMLKDGKIGIDEAERRICMMGVRRLGEIRIDMMRRSRTGIPEVVFAEGKKPSEVASIIMNIVESEGIAMATRASDEHYEEVRKVAHEYEVKYNRIGRTISVKRKGINEERRGKVGVLTAGSLDIPVAEEACETLELMGCDVIKAYDVGVAGIHRLVEPLENMLESKVDSIIVVAGMEGALPSVVAALVNVPVIAVPTSVGYGVGKGGIAALLTMLQTCSPGVAVVNIDNGFGAGVMAGMIARRR